MATFSCIDKALLARLDQPPAARSPQPPFSRVDHETRIFELAAQRGWSMAELARRMAVSESYLSRIRSGERRLRATAYEGGIRAFPGIPVEYLFPRLARRRSA